MTLFDYLNEMYNKDHNPEYYQEQTLLQEYAKCKNVEDALSQYRRFYEHIIKWYFADTKQNVSWINTCFDCSDSLAYGLYKSYIGTRYKIPENMILNAYKLGENDAKIALKGMNVPIDKIRNILEEDDRFMDIKYLSNPNFIRIKSIYNIGGNSALRQEKENQINREYNNSLRHRNEMKIYTEYENIEW